MMGNHLYSARGCARCRIVKDFLAEKKIEFIEYDIKGEGKDAFKLFYKENRKQVRRGQDGIEFPLLEMDGSVLQGIGPILSTILSGSRLEESVRPRDPEPGWLGGLNIFRSALKDRAAFLELLGFVKSRGLSIELEADGRNPTLLSDLAQQKLVDRLIFILRGPSALYAALTGEDLPEADLAQSLSCLSSFPEYQINLPIVPVKRDDKMITYLTPEEAATAANAVEKATGIKTHPFFIQPAEPHYKGMEIAPLEQSDLFRYRTRCRRFMVKSEILKNGL